MIVRSPFAFAPRASERDALLDMTRTATASASASSSAACARERRRSHSTHRAASRSRASAIASSSKKRLEVITFDLDDTLWPTTPVVNAANEALIDWCTERLGQKFPKTPVVHAAMKLVREERDAQARARGDAAAEPMSYAAIRIAGAVRAARACGIPEHDAVAVIARGYHLAWIPTRNDMARRLVFPGVREALASLREAYPNATIGSITNGFGSATGAGLGEFFDFEISAEALIDEHMVHGEMARKPHAYPFQLAMGIACGEHGYSGDADTWVHVGDDVLNDCYCAKQLDLRTVHVKDPNVNPYQSGGGAPYAETSMRGAVEADAASHVDGVVTHVRELPGLLSTWYA